MSYIICCGDKYIKYENGKKGHRITSKKSEAYKWKEMQKAKNMCYTLMGSNKFNNSELKVVEYKDDFITMIETGNESSRETFIPDISVIKDDDLEANSNGYMTEYKALSEKVMKDYEGLQNELNIRKTKLQREISNVDMEIVDLKHYAEFYNLNAYDGYKMYKMLHDTTQRRRKIKNEIAEIDSFRNYLKNTKSFYDVLHAEKKYKPRVLKDLFTRGV